MKMNFKNNNKIIFSLCASVSLWLRLGFFLFFCLFILISCAGIKAEKEEALYGTLVVYFYSERGQVDINFTIEGLEIKKKDGGWVKLSEKPINISSADIINDQIFLTESNLGEGEYERIMIRISNASIRKEEKYHTLALPQPNKEIEIKGNIIGIRSGESRAIFLMWEADKSVSRDYLFSPAITIEPQKISPKTLLLYIANSGSNYVSVVDRFENRVVGVIGVGKNPTGLALSKEQERLYVLNSRSNSISIIDTSQDFVRDRIQFASGIEPIEMAMVPYSDRRNHGKLYITNQGSNDVTVIDTFMKSQIKNIQVGNTPIGVSANPLRQEVYVANSGSNSISIIDSTTDTVKATVSVDRMPVDVVTVKDSIYVLNSGSDSITILDAVTKTIKSRIQGGAGPRKGIYSEQNNRVYLSNYGSGQVSFLIPSSAVITRSIDVGNSPIGLAVDEGRNRLYIADYNSNRVIVMNSVSEVVEDAITVGNKPYGIVSVK
jgi:YVTN family beta-propeller protein